MAPTTQLAFADVLGLDVCGVVDSFRPMRAFRARVDQRRAELNLAKRRWIALFKKREATRRFDVWLPPYPSEGHIFSCRVVGCDVSTTMVSRC
jgi:hypothetical protein